MNRIGSEIVMLFLRWPAAGQVKTRLIPTIGANAATLLYDRLATHAIATFDALNRPGLTRHAWVTPRERVADWEARLGERWTVIAQPDGDLGARLEAAFRRAFLLGARRVLVAGSDCPGLTTVLLDGALDALREHDAVLGPAKDGGYYALGLTREDPGLFRGIDWSTEQVFGQTMERLARSGRQTQLLPALRDLDTLDDLESLQRTHPWLRI